MQNKMEEEMRRAKIAPTGGSNLISMNTSRVMSFLPTLLHVIVTMSYVPFLAKSQVESPAYMGSKL
jgi:hypothetical protein